MGERKAATCSSFSERVKNTLGNFFPFTMGTGTGDKVDTQEEEVDNGETDEFESEVSLNSSAYENEASMNMETCYSEALPRLLMDYNSQESS